VGDKILINIVNWIFEIFRLLREANIPSIFVLIGLVFLFFSIVGTIGSLVNLDNLQRKEFRIASFICLTLGFVIAISSVFNSPSPIPPPPPQPVKLSIDGSSSMIDITLNDKKKFEEKFPGSKITVKDPPSGSKDGLLKLSSGKIDIATFSCDLPEDERNHLKVKMLKRGEGDIAVIVGSKNPLEKLTMEQLKNIFNGTEKLWSNLKVNVPIKPPNATKNIVVLNRPSSSGTYECFKRKVLGDEDFGKGFVELDRSSSTPWLHRLNEENAIGYAESHHVSNQKIAKVVAIDDRKPGQSEYPLKRGFYYVYREQPSPEVKAFIDFISSQ
jgi:phosphate transport system substrate-binding protein